VAWHMVAADAAPGAPPAYVLVAAADGFDCADCPTWYPGDEEVDVPAVGITGTGPDTVRIPDSAEPGTYVVCADGDAEHCARITVTAPPPTVTDDTVADDTDADTGSEASTHRFELPAGEITASADDLLVLHADGDLYLHRGVLAGGDQLERLVDMTDPRAPVVEGPGPNVVDDVTGIIDGALVYADCCEPVSGNLLAVTSPGADPHQVGFGYAPTLEPAGGRLATANDFAACVLDLPTRTATCREVNTDPAVPYRTAVDVAWTGDGAVVVVLAVDVDGYVLMPFRADAVLTPLPVARLELPAADPTAGFSQFAGLAPSGEIVVVAAVAGTTELRFLDPTSFEEEVSRRRTLPEPVSSVRVAPDGRGALWVADGELWYEPAGDAARVVAVDAIAAWFVRSA
jgi:hypothetical protein